MRVAQSNWRLLLLLSTTLIIASSAWAAEEGPEQPAEPLPLPEATDIGEKRIKVPVGGARITLDHLGPAIVAEDGTLRRITNWDVLSPAEKKTALRRIAERNKVRIEVLQQQVKDLEATQATPASEPQTDHSQGAAQGSNTGASASAAEPHQEL